MRADRALITRRTTLGALLAAVFAAPGCTDAQGLDASVVSVRDPRFAGGALGDGRSDDTQAIQAAIDAAQVILIPAGTYMISASLRVPSGRRIVGQGIDTVLRKRSEDGLALIVNAQPQGDTAISIESLVVDGAREARAFVAFRDGVHLTRCAGCRISNVVVRNCLNDGIIIEYGKDNRVEQCIVYGNAKDGIYLSGTAEGFVGANSARDNSLAGIAIAASITTIVRDSICRGNRADILLGRDARTIEVTKNTCRSDIAFAISPEPLPGQVLHGKRYPGRGERGSRAVYGASHCHIHDNVFAGQVRLILLNDSEFLANECTGSRTQGIVLQGASRNRIAGNSILNWGKGYGGLQVAALSAADGIPPSQSPPIASSDNVLGNNRIASLPDRPAVLDGGIRTIRQAGM